MIHFVDENKEENNQFYHHLSLKLKAKDSIRIDVFGTHLKAKHAFMNVRNL